VPFCGSDLKIVDNFKDILETECHNTPPAKLNRALGLLKSTKFHEKLKRQESRRKRLPQLEAIKSNSESTLILRDQDLER